ncbi:MAG TPA: DUF192 domain-containing protein [Desulfopila sp.]|nr:DUF192 domain-containing protein [Desulfopila sp.]
MIPGQIRCGATDTLLLQRVGLTETVLERTRGLLGTSVLEAGAGLLIQPCNSVHTWFMKYSIDVVFLDRTSRIIKIVNNLKPYRYTGAFRAQGVLELRAGMAVEIGLQSGNLLLWEREKF